MTYPIEGWVGFGPLCTSADWVRQHGAKLRRHGLTSPITFSCAVIPERNSSLSEVLAEQLRRANSCADQARFDRAANV
jgi:hypothetical protein